MIFGNRYQFEDMCYSWTQKNKMKNALTDFISFFTDNPTMDNLSNLVNATFANLTISTPHDNLDAIAAIAPPLWGILVAVGAVGNGLVIFTLMRHGEKSPTNCFIINLGVADLTFIVIVLPFTILMYVTRSWELGEGTCKTFHYMTYVST